MPRKKSVRLAADSFNTRAAEISEFLEHSISSLTKKEQSWCHDFAIIALYRAFEDLMLSALVAAINNDTATISSSTGIDFPKHLTDEVCEYLVVGGGYFDFKGRPGLIKILKSYVPDDHYLLTVVKKPKYTAALDQLSGLRNFAAHGGPTAKRNALSVTGHQRMESAGSWLKVSNRYNSISTKLVELATDLRANAPF